MRDLGRLVVPSMLAMALAAGLSVTASASPDDRYSSSSSYSTNGRQVTTNFESERSSRGNGDMSASGSYRDHDDDGRYDDRDDDRDDGHDDHDGGAGGDMSGDHDGGDHDGGDHDGGDDGGDDD